MVNNFDIIIPQLVFDTDDDFYFIQIIRRRKENPELSSNNKVTKTYYVSSIDYLNSKKEEIIELCNRTNARAYINLNRRSYHKIALQMLRKVSDIILNGNPSSVAQAYDSVCGLYSNEKNKKWVVDIDEDTIDDAMIEFINNECEPFDDNKEILRVRTKNGFHLITKPFNVKKFHDRYPEIDIHKNNPTILYAS